MFNNCAARFIPQAGRGKSRSIGKVENDVHVVIGRNRRKLSVFHTDKIAIICCAMKGKYGSFLLKGKNRQVFAWKMH